VVAKLCGVVVIAAWAIGNAVVLFGILKYFGMLRVSVEIEEQGMDEHEHGGSAYEHAIHMLQKDPVIARLLLAASKRASQFSVRVHVRAVMLLLTPAVT
jgi:hypothetical protein